MIQGNADIEDRKTIERVWTTQGNKRCNLGDLILTVRAPVGAIAIASENACIGRGVCGLKPFGDSSFLFHALVHAENRWQAFEQGSTFTAANSEQVGQFRLFVPEDENEQRAIAEVLSDVDGLLNALEALIAKKQAIKQSVMQQLLTAKTRLPGFSGAWERGILADFGVFQSGSGFPLAFQGHQSGDYPFFKVSDLSGQGNQLFMNKANHYISEDVRRKLGAIRLEPGSIVFAKIGAAIFLEQYLRQFIRV